MLRWVMRPTRSRSITGPIPTNVLPTCGVAFEDRLFSAALKSVSQTVSHDSGLRTDSPRLLRKPLLPTQVPGQNLSHNYFPRLRF